MKSIFYIILFSFTTTISPCQNKSCEVEMKKIQGVYSGACKNGKAHGQGKSEGEDIYEGLFRKGWPHGYGKYIWRDGKIYEGDFKRGKKDGFGQITDIVQGVVKTTKGYWRQDEYIGEKNLPLYQVVEKQSIEGVKITRLNESGSSIRIRMVRDGNLNQTVSNVFISSDSGSLREINGEYFIDDIVYPVEIMVKFNSPNRMNTIALSCRSTFKINIKGDWIVNLDH